LPLGLLKPIDRQGDKRLKKAARQGLERPEESRFGRSKPINRKLLFLLILAIALLILPSINTGCQQRGGDWQMIIKAPHSDTIHYRIPVRPMDEFTLRYRHSVSLSSVEGIFLITTEGTIQPLTTTFSTYGPGLPVDSTGDYSIEDGLITVYSDEEPREKIRLWVSPQTEEKIVFRDREYNLSSLSGDHLLLEITVEQNYDIS
jgi:hypothetical protein